MPPFDTHPVLGHPEVAAWALSALDQPDAETFGEHLASCSEPRSTAVILGWGLSALANR